MFCLPPTSLSVHTRALKAGSVLTCQVYPAWHMEIWDSCLLLAGRNLFCVYQRESLHAYSLFGFLTFGRNMVSPVRHLRMDSTVTADRLERLRKISSGQPAMQVVTWKKVAKKCNSKLYSAIGHLLSSSNIHYAESLRHALTFTDMIQTLESYPMRQRLTGNETNIHHVCMTDWNTHPPQEE